MAAFLRAADLGQYAAALMRSGFDELDVLCDMEDNDMRDLGIRRGHAVKLRRRLQDYRAAQQGTGEQGPALSEAHSSQPSGSTLPDAARTVVEWSWEQVQAQGIEQVAQTFYRHLFLMAPEAIGLFSPEVRLKYRDWISGEGDQEGNVYESPALRKLFSKMLNAIGCTVAGLHDFGKLVPMLSQLGSRHLGYGVVETHWPLLGRALSCTLRDCLGSAFSGEVETAWTMVFSFMSSIMIEGRRGAAAAKPAPGCWAEPPLSKLSQSGPVAEELLPSRASQGGPWVEDCRSQVCRPDLSNRVVPGTASIVAALPQIPSMGRCKPLPRLWEDDDCHSEDSLSTGAPSQLEAAAQRQISPWSQVSRQPTPESYAEGQ